MVGIQLTHQNSFIFSPNRNVTKTHQPNRIPSSLNSTTKQNAAQGKRKIPDSQSIHRKKKIACKVQSTLKGGNRRTYQLTEHGGVSWTESEDGERIGVCRRSAEEEREGVSLQLQTLRLRRRKMKEEIPDERKQYVKSSAPHCEEFVYTNKIIFNK